MGGLPPPLISKALRLVAAEQARRQRALSAGISKKALEEDASIYDYDGVYDEIKEKQSHEMLARAGINAGGAGAGRAGGAETGGRKAPRYIHKLQQACKVREVEFDRVYERQLLKEQEEEKKKFGDQAGERFVTSAYKKQLQELRKWDTEDARRENAVEEATTAERAGMHGFYANLLTKNIGMGADVEKSAISGYTHGSKKHNVMTTDLSGLKEEEKAAAAATSAAATSSSKPAQSADFEAEALRQAIAARKATAADATKRPDGAIKPDPDTTDADDGGKKTPRQPDDAVVKPDPEAEKAKCKEAVDSARERFLARKRAKTTGGTTPQGDNPS